MIIVIIVWDKRRDFYASTVISDCPKLTQKQYKRRHDNVSRKVQWELCQKHELERSDRLY